MHSEKHWISPLSLYFLMLPLESQQIRHATGSKHVPSAVFGLKERKAKNMNHSLCSLGASWLL